MDHASSVNILLRTFPGLSFPPTVSFSLPSAATTTELLNYVTSILPPSLPSHFTLLTTSNLSILPSTTPISTLLSSSSSSTTTTRATPPTNQPHHASPLLPLHLLPLLPGGKGGFGSQLRAAGGRMSSRKRKNALASDPNNGVGSNRNLDGRRLRTITEAKNLAEYLATKPEMERREKEERRRKWEGVVEGVERRKGEVMKGGRKGDVGGKGRGLSEEWLEEREDAGERTREAVRKVMADGGWSDYITAGRVTKAESSASASGSGASREPSEEEEEDDDSDDQVDDAMDLDETELKTLEKEAADGDVDAIWVLRNQVKKPAQPPAKKRETRYIGFDEDDEYMSSSEEDEEVASLTVKGKGKQKVLA